MSRTLKLDFKAMLNGIDLPGEEIIKQRNKAQREDLEAAQGREAGVLGGLAPPVARAIMVSSFHVQASHAHVPRMWQARSVWQFSDTICVPP